MNSKFDAPLDWAAQPEPKSGGNKNVQRVSQGAPMYYALVWRGIPSMPRVLLLSYHSSPARAAHKVARDESEDFVIWDTRQPWPQGIRTIESVS